jgi:trk system potassium uptake protein TrkH
VNERGPESGPPTTDESRAPGHATRARARIDRFNATVLARLNLAGLMLVMVALCTADFLAAGSVLWATVFTIAQAVLSIPWAATVLKMDHAEARILDSKRLGRLRRVLSHVGWFAALAAVLFAKAAVLRAAPAEGEWAHESAYHTYACAAFVIFVVGLVGRGTRLARFIGSIADHPTRLMAISFAVVALFGGLTLTLPVSLQRVEDANFVDGLFTATSAVCVTGLAVNDVCATYTTFGQVVIFLLIQAGGLGIMVLTAAVAILAGRRLQTRSTATLTEMIDAESFSVLRRTIRHIFVFTVVTEVLGAGVLYAVFVQRHPEIGLGPEDASPLAGAGNQVWSAVFHSVSAFCNAGFSLCHGNLSGFVGSFPVSGTIAVLITLGGLGFPVLDEMWMRWRHRTHPEMNRRLSLHVRVVLIASALLFVAGTLAFLALEWDRTLRDLPFGDKLIAAAFQSVTTRTAGFNTIDFAAMGAPILAVTMILMFIGASPASTGGGIKTTTTSVIASGFLSEMRGGGRPRLFDRALPELTVRRAFMVLLGAMAVVVIGWVALLATEEIDPFRLLFETVSAFATCGLSAGVTPKLSDPGRLVITLVMFVGRIGPVTLALALVARPRVRRFEVPEERVLIG